MKRWLRALIASLFLMGPVLSAPATREDIKQAIQYMDKRFEDMQKQMDKRFEAVDKRFEDMNKRFDMLMWFIGILTVLSTALISYMISRINRHEDKLADAETRFQHVDLSTLLRDLREADPAIKKGFKEILK